MDSVPPSIHGHPTGSEMPTEPQPIRIGIIGAGIAGGRHADAFAQHPGATVAAVAEIDEQRGRELASTFGARAFRDYRDLLAAGIDAVVICLPHHLHLACAREAARSGAHILMEKPLATTLEEAHAILQTVTDAGVTFMMGYVHRFRPEVEAAHRLIAEGRLGRPVMLLDRFISGGMHETPAWVWNRSMAGGGVLMYGGVHAIDRLRWLLGDEVTEVFAKTASYSNPAEVEDGVCALLTFASSASALLYENAPAYGRLGGWVTEIFGTQGALVITTGTTLEYRGTTGSAQWSYQGDDRFARQATEFLAAIRQHRPPTVTGNDGLRGLEVALAIYRSAATGKPEPV
jgi:predicted dehydrogenase